MSGLCGNWNGDVRDEPGDASYGYVGGDTVDSGENMKPPEKYAYSGSGVSPGILVPQGGATAYDIVQYGPQGTPSVRGSTATNADGSAIILGGNIDRGIYQPVTAEVATSYNADGSVASSQTQTQVLDFFADNKKFGWSDPRNLFRQGAPGPSVCWPLPGSSQSTCIVQDNSLTMWYRAVGSTFTQENDAAKVSNSAAPSAQLSGTSINFIRPGVENAAFLSGGPSSTVSFGALPNIFTVCAATSFQGPNKGRILQADNGVTGKWMFGHDGGIPGIVNFNDQWLVSMAEINQQTSSLIGIKTPPALQGWLLMCSTNDNTMMIDNIGFGNNGGSIWTLDQNCNFQNLWIGKQAMYSIAGTGGSNVKLNIGATVSEAGANSDWGLFELMVYNRRLSDNEMQTNLKYLQGKLVAALGLKSACG